MELWDIYDINRNLVGRTHLKGTTLKKGEYHLVVHIWIKNNDGKYLITKRAPNKDFPNMWECTGGSAIKGDSSLNAALREAKEEVGIDLNPKNGQIIDYIKTDHAHIDIWLFKQNFSLSDVVLQEFETCDAKVVTKEEVLQMMEKGIFIPHNHIKDHFSKL